MSMNSELSHISSVIEVGISACLLGKKVRYDAGHKRNRFVTDVLAQFLDLVPVCPELDVGMGVPREPVQLIGTAAAPRMVGVNSGNDWTSRMRRYSRSRVKRMSRNTLSGFILKRNSPSCGIERVEIFGESGRSQKSGRGLFVAALMDCYPLLPVEDEERLNDAALRENFIVRVFAYHRLKELFSGRFSRNPAVQFHTAHKYLMLAHSPVHYRQLGKLVADIKNMPVHKFRDQYSRVFMEGLQTRSTVKKNVNVLHHILGHLKNVLAAGDKQAILNAIDDYHKSLVPLVVPLTFLRHHVDKHRVEYIQNQVYLFPHPKELMLRNHV
jgi:uncharacterized protein YbgA (DUF1722 family)/uncharacterized protein YbbK (DUF523 family)